MLFSNGLILFGILLIFVIKSSLGVRLRPTWRPMVLQVLNISILAYWLGPLNASIYILKLVLDFAALRFLRTQMHLWIFVAFQVLLIVIYKYALQPTEFGLREFGLSFHLLFICQYAFSTVRDGSERLSFRDQILVFTYFPVFLAGPVTPVHQLRDDLIHADPKQAEKNQAPDVSRPHEDLAPIVLLFFLGLLKISLKTFLDPHISLGIIETSFSFNVLFYFEMSGYSDLAIAFSRLIGVRLSPNFDRPLLRLSVTKMWQTWHMSVMNWFNDYVYFPLQYARWLRWIPPRLRFRLIVICTFTVVGIWHRFSPAFIVWGLLNGILVAAESLIPSGVQNRLLELPKVSRFAVNSLRLFYVWLTTGLLRWITDWPAVGWTEFISRVRGLLELPIFANRFESLGLTVITLICFAVVSLIEVRLSKLAVSPTATFLFAAIAAFLFAIIWFDGAGTYSYGRL